ncbi:MAG: ABC transporter ATP-binding protein, partial [Thermodesulfovibrionia bacterium]|nr:ABC transporter ATP-binding protein [Thermodesulfovibrionia bacterium]
MLEIKDLTVSMNGKRILNDINLSIGRGETVALFGPNGSGKTSLLKTIMGIPGYSLDSGRIIFRDKDIVKLSVDERARLGIGIAFQRPPVIRGVRLKDLLQACMKKRRGDFKEQEMNESAVGLNLLDFLERDINLGFSGGEMKRSELLQLLAQRPDMIMLDEPDSGVDLVSITLVGKVINELLQKNKKASRRTSAGLLITHAGHLLDYVNA